MRPLDCLISSSSCADLLFLQSFLGDASTKSILGVETWDLAWAFWVFIW